VAPVSAADARSAAASSSVARSADAGWLPAFRTGGNLVSVAAVSAHDVWSVGGTSGGKPMILRWNGTAWKHVSSPAPAGSVLRRVAATSASNAWAVGSYGTSNSRTLILHWNGTTWKQVPSPSPGGGSYLAGVAATSASNAWAVGYYDNSHPRTL